VDPVLVVHLEGWIDAGLGGATATASLLEGGTAEPVAVFDGDWFIDYRARRPTVHIQDGVNQGLTWPQIRLLLTTDRDGRDMLFLVGPEPDMRWTSFVNEVVELAVGLGVRMSVGLGAFPAPVPHTRPVRLASTTTEPELAGRVGFVAGNIEVPANVEAALELGFQAAGIPAIGLWARVPHYVAALPFPAASAALISGLASVAELNLDITSLDSAADLARRRVDDLIANSQEHQTMVTQLEATVDSSEGTSLDIGEIPSGDEIAAELQRFLRNQE
jgi:hypothetical protein